MVWSWKSHGIYCALALGAGTLDKMLDILEKNKITSVFCFYFCFCFLFLKKNMY